MVNTFQGYVELTGRQNLALMTFKNNSHLPEFQRVRKDVSKRWLLRMNQFLQLSNLGTRFDDKAKDIVGLFTLDQTKQDNFLRHVGLVRCSVSSSTEDVTGTNFVGVRIKTRRAENLSRSSKERSPPGSTPYISRYFTCERTEIKRENMISQRHGEIRKIQVSTEYTRDNMQS